VVFPLFPFFWGWVTLSSGVEVTQAPTASLDDAPTGGVQLDVLPRRARVFVDGVLVGRVDDFHGYYQHLTVAAGPHQIAIIEPGYEPLVLDLTVPPGRTMTYRGTLSQALSR